jgi:hypothetical protein
MRGSRLSGFIFPVAGIPESVTGSKVLRASIHVSVRTTTQFRLRMLLLLPQITNLQHYITRHTVNSVLHFCIGFTWNLRSVPAVALGRLSRDWLLLVIERSCTS